MAVLFRNLIGAIEATRAIPAVDSSNNTTYVLQDPFRIWFEASSEWDNLSHPLPSNVGEKLSRLSVAGLVNALAGMEGGAVDKTGSIRLPEEEAEQILKSSGGVNLRDLALLLHKAIDARLQLDQLLATPARIHVMMCPDMDPSQLKNIRHRVRSTVDQNGEKPDNVHLSTQCPTNKRLAAEEQDFKCVVCDNVKQSLFVLDRKNGDVICSSCGAVACEKIIHQGSQYRNFEGEPDRNHSGAAYNPLFSNAHNTATGLTRGVFSAPRTTSAMKGQSVRGLHTTHAYIEMNICHLGGKLNDTKKETRTGYKDQQKKKAFVRMQHVGDALDLNVAVLTLAKEYYSKFRESRQILKDPEGVIAACLCEAYAQATLDGRSRLEADIQKLEKVAIAQEWSKVAASKATQRVLRRKMLHSVHFAANNGGENRNNSADSVIRQNGGRVLECKPVASWDIHDSRTWLLWASQTMAKRKLQLDETSRATLDDLEGRCVEQSLRICEYLESNEESAFAGKKMLILTPKKLSNIIGDATEAKAFHQMIRGVVTRQAVRKSHAVRQKASQLRFQQIKR